MNILCAMCVCVHRYIYFIVMCVGFDEYVICVQKCVYLLSVPFVFLCRSDEYLLVVVL